MKRREAREKIVQCLFQLDMTDNEPREALNSVLDYTSNEDTSFVEESVIHTWQNREEIDLEIKKYLTGWDLERIANVDRAILRLAVYEMLYRSDIPPHVSVNEAVELTKVFSTDESAKFVNGVLGKMVKEREDQIES